MPFSCKQSRHDVWGPTTWMTACDTILQLKTLFCPHAVTEKLHSAQRWWKVQFSGTKRENDSCSSSEQPAVVRKTQLDHKNEQNMHKSKTHTHTHPLSICTQAHTYTNDTHTHTFTHKLSTVLSFFNYTLKVLLASGLCAYVCACMCVRALHMQSKQSHPDTIQ